MKKKIDVLFKVVMIALSIWVGISFIDVIMHNTPGDNHNYFSGNAFVLFNELCRMFK